jgi:hypothetical protein
MEDDLLRVKLEKLLVEAQDCELISRLATDKQKRELFEKLATDLRNMARDIEAKIAGRTPEGRNGN